MVRNSENAMHFGLEDFMSETKGRVTIPTDLDVIPQTLELMGKWGADAVRDCDGTDFPQELQDVDAKIGRAHV